MYTAITNHGSLTTAKAPQTIGATALNFGADFNVIAQSPNEVRLISNKSPLGREDKFRFAVSDVANIYTNSGIDRAAQSQLKTGTKILIGGSTVHTFTDENGNTYDKPMYGTFTMTVPKDPAESEELVADFVGMMFAAMSEWAKSEASGSPDMQSRLWNMLRHVLNPQEVE
jgi:hypothetical protein